MQSRRWRLGLKCSSLLMRTGMPVGRVRHGLVRAAAPTPPSPSTPSTRPPVSKRVFRRRKAAMRRMMMKRRRSHPTVQILPAKTALKKVAGKDRVKRTKCLLKHSSVLQCVVIL